jgi:hypothetical protein
MLWQTKHNAICECTRICALAADLTPSQGSGRGLEIWLVCTAESDQGLFCGTVFEFRVLSL